MFQSVNITVSITTFSKLVTKTDGIRPTECIESVNVIRY